MALVGAFGRDRVERPVVVGCGATAIGDLSGRTPTDLGIDALDAALEGTGIAVGEVEGIYLVPEGYTRAAAPLRTQRLAERLGLRTRACVEVESGGTSSMLALKAACQDIALGHLDVAVVVGAQCERRLFRSGMDAGDLDRVFLISSMYGAWLAPYGVVAALPSYALAGQRYMHEHDLPPEEIAEVAVRLRANAAANPNAELRDPLTVEDVLASRVVCPPIHKLEAAPWSDGGAAVVVVGAEYARRQGLSGAALTGWGERHDDGNFIPFGKSLTRYPWIAQAAGDALGRSGRRLEEIDVMEVYGAFAHAELMTYEAIGLFGPGEAPAAVAAGETAIDGRIPVNPSGGRLSYGHPPQATPLLMVGEIFAQLCRAAGDRQVADAGVGLVQAEHGMMNGTTIAVLETEG